MGSFASADYSQVRQPKRSNKYPENVFEPQIVQRVGGGGRERVREGPEEGRRGRAEVAGSLGGSAVRSAGETQFTLPCRHPG